jgi:hypothetical protein
MLFEHLRPGAGGGRHRREMAAPLERGAARLVVDLHAPFIHDFTGFDQPWRLLAGFVPDLKVTELGAGGGYLAVGHARGPLEHTQQ